MRPQLLRWCIACTVILLCGCAATSSRLVTDSALSAEFSVENLFPPNPVAGLPDQLIRKGITALYADNLAEASASFNQALRQNPRNSYLQLLNGLSYHLMAEAGDAKQYELAKVGYQLALKFDHNNWLAALQLARVHLRTKDYRQAQEYFAYALLYQPDNPHMLYGLAQASYYTRDIATARGAIKRARELSPDDLHTMAASSMISAASGQAEDARGHLARYRQMKPEMARIEHVAERVEDWLKIYDDKKILLASDSYPPSSEINPPLYPDPSQENSSPAMDGSQETPGQRMAVIDVVMIRTEEGESTSKGVNLLDGLTLQFSDTFLSFKDTLTRDLTASTRTHTNERIASSQLSIADVRYNMNIFNIGEDRTEVLARPTLVAIEGQKSTFFSGSQLAVAISGTDTGSLEKIDVGVKLEVTPTFVTDDRLLINVAVGRMFVEPGVVGSFKESVKVSKNEVNANVTLKFGQSLILSGLREKQTSELKSGVPILGDLPIVQYLFSREKTEDFHKSIITILTPRRMQPGVYVTPSKLDAGDPLKEELTRLPYLSELKKSSRALLTADDNIQHIVRHLGKHHAVREFRESDLFDKVWYGSEGDLGNILKKSITFLYY